MQTLASIATIMSAIPVIILLMALVFKMLIEMLKVEHVGFDEIDEETEAFINGPNRWD